MKTVENTGKQIAKRVQLPCGNPDCDKTVIRTEYQLSQIVTKPYCSQACTTKCNKGPSKYTPEVIQSIIDNVVAYGYKKMAAHVGTTIGALKRSIDLLRKKGHDIPYLRLKKVGDIVPNGRKLVQKQEDGRWKYVGMINPRAKAEPKARVRKVREKKAPKVKAKVQSRIISSSAGRPARRAPAPPAQQLPTKKIDPKQLKTIRIDSKTYLQVDRSIPDSEAIAKWLTARGKKTA